ncbi:MAG: hypothetical protein JSR80_05865 [Verrucomicrobia bacterium]|nr:hypothetical protein [Verrucomicrobiota bacterium]
MNLNDQEKEYLLNEYLRNISHILDKEYQKRVWIRQEGPECQAFDDAVCDFFDIGDPILDEYKDFGITDSQHRLLIKFRNQFREFCREHDFPEEFMDGPEWAQIMDHAKEVLRAFNYHQKS